MTLAAFLSRQLTALRIWLFSELLSLMFSFIQRCVYVGFELVEVQTQLLSDLCHKLLTDLHECLLCDPGFKGKEGFTVFR